MDLSSDSNLKWFELTAVDLHRIGRGKGEFALKEHGPNATFSASAAEDFKAILAFALLVNAQRELLQELRADFVAGDASALPLSTLPLKTVSTCHPLRLSCIGVPVDIVFDLALISFRHAPIRRPREIFRALTPLPGFCHCSGAHHHQ